MARPHRYFYVNGVLQFSLFFNADEIDQAKIAKEFLESSLWQWEEKRKKVKVVKVEFSDDLRSVYLTTR